MKNNLIPAFLLLVLLGSCSSGKKTSSSGSSSSRKQSEMLDENSFRLTAISDDDSYGYTEKNPVKVGGVKNNSGPLNERRFLNALLGPGGETLTYNRQGSCCPFKSRNGLMGSGLLDKYEVKYDGLEKPLIIYINMYDAGELKAPKGFTFKQ
jgi:hypothetical protein